jgi:hypothetical protein
LRLAVFEAERLGDEEDERLREALPEAEVDGDLPSERAAPACDAAPREAPAREAPAGAEELLPDPEAAELDPEAAAERDPDAEADRDVETDREEPLLPASVAAVLDSPALASGFVSGDLASDLESADLASAPEVLSSFSTARLRLFSLSDLKSVSYQPAPFNRNTGAETSFFIRLLPHEGHLFSGGSEIFCRSSV